MLHMGCKTSTSATFVQHLAAACSAACVQAATQDLLPHNGTQPESADGHLLESQTQQQQGQVVEQQLNQQQQQQQQGSVLEKQVQSQSTHMQHPSSEGGEQPSNLQPVLIKEQQQLPPSPAAAAATGLINDGDVMELESLYD